VFLLLREEKGGLSDGALGHSAAMSTQCLLRQASGATTSCSLPAFPRGTRDASRLLRRAKDNRGPINAATHRRLSQDARAAAPEPSPAVGSPWACLLQA
jgi:hypothetical protein